MFLSPVVDEAAAPASAVAKVEPAISAVTLETVNENCELSVTVPEKLALKLKSFVELSPAISVNPENVAVPELIATSPNSVEPLY